MGEEKSASTWALFWRCCTRQAPVEVSSESVREVVLALPKPPVEWMLAEAKPDPDRGPKPENA